MCKPRSFSEKKKKCIHCPKFMVFFEYKITDKSPSVIYDRQKHLKLKTIQFGYPAGPVIGHLDTGFSWFPCSFIHLVVCLTTGPKPLPNRALHIVRSRASSFKCEYPLLSLRSSSSFLRFLPRLPVTSIFSLLYFLQ